MQVSFSGSEEVRREGRAVTLNLRENTDFSTERGMKIMKYVQVIFVNKRIISAVKRTELLVIGCHT
jgi:hypothetical protein